jgi:hypothetical protein
MATRTPGDGMMVNTVSSFGVAEFEAAAFEARIRFGELGSWDGIRFSERRAANQSLTCAVATFCPMRVG